MDQEDFTTFAAYLEPVLRREMKRVSRANRRAERAGQAATLTLEEWLATLHGHNWRCALCGGPFETMEHYQPLSEGGGSTQSNCMPCCQQCNEARRNAHRDIRRAKEMLRALVIQSGNGVTGDVMLRFHADASAILDELGGLYRQFSPLEMVFSK